MIIVSDLYSFSITTDIEKNKDEVVEWFKKFGYKLYWANSIYNSKLGCIGVSRELKNTICYASHNRTSIPFEELNEIILL